MKSPSFTLGIEEEYQTVDPVTKELRSHVHAELLSKSKARMEDAVKAEMHVSVIEVGTSVCRDIADASATTARCVEIAAQVLHARGSPEAVVRLLASATALRNALGAPVPPDEQPELERTLAAARSALSSRAFLEASADGGRLDIQQAVELAADTLSSV